jgi:hypothetical protein
MNTTQTERQALDAAIKRALGSTGFVRAVGAAVAESLTADERGIVLPPFCATTLKHLHDRCDTWTSSTDGAGWNCYFYRVFDGRRAGTWCGSESRLDSTGKKWERSIKFAGIDDFGNLVEVPQ